MDCFDSRYYRLNRNMLILFGQWPYQNYAHRVKIWIAYACIMVTGVIVEVGKALKDEKMTFDLWLQFISFALAGTTSMMRYFTFTVYNDKITRLLDKMRADWQCITNANEYQILCESAEATRLFMVQYSTVAGSGTAMFSLTILSSPLLIYTPFFNETCPVINMYSDDYIVDPEKYCLPIVVHICIVISLLLLGTVATDTMFMAILYHAAGMFKIVCYRLEHAFDHCTEETKYISCRTNVYEKIASAVECHQSVLRFGDDICDAFQLSNLFSLILTLLSIAVALYWAAMSKGNGLDFKPIFALSICGGMMTHLFFVMLPSQRMIDNSEAVIFRAYSSMWYMAPAREQSLLLLTMQRGLKPTAMVVGKMHAATLENFAVEVQASFSYFTLLMSMQ